MKLLDTIAAIIIATVLTFREMVKVIGGVAVDDDSAH